MLGRFKIHLPESDCSLRITRFMQFVISLCQGNKITLLGIRIALSHIEYTSKAQRKSCAIGNRALACLKPPVQGIRTNEQVQDKGGMKSVNPCRGKIEKEILGDVKVTMNGKTVK